MKKLLLMMLVFGAVSTGSLYAQSKTPPVVLSTFQRSFRNATDASWSSVKDVFRVDFVSGKEKIAAFFNHDGDLIASSRNVNITEIPLSLKADLKKHFNEYEVSGLLEVEKEDRVFYFATVKNDKSQVMLKSFAFGGWVIEQADQE